MSKAKPMLTPPNPACRRLRCFQLAERQAAILADLATHGPSTFREVNLRLFEVMGEQLLRDTIQELVESGRLSTELRTRARMVGRGGHVWPIPYQVTVYSMAGPSMGKQPCTGGQAQASLKPPTSPPLPPSRLPQHFRPELETVVLADLANHGPSVFSDIKIRLLDVMGEHLVQRTLNELAEAGRVVVEAKTLTRKAQYGDKLRSMRYKARVYALVSQPKRMS